MQFKRFRAFVKVLLDEGCFSVSAKYLVYKHQFLFNFLSRIDIFPKELNLDWINLCCHNIFWTYSLCEAYPVIGVMDHLDKSLRVFERRLPTFFGGIHDLYYRKLKGVFS